MQPEGRSAAGCTKADNVDNAAEAKGMLRAISRHKGAGAQFRVCAPCAQPLWKLQIPNAKFQLECGYAKSGASLK